MRNLLIAMWLTGCGAPLLHDVPRPDPAYVAAGAAAVASALTLLQPGYDATESPDADAWDVGPATATPDGHTPVQVVPESVFDHLGRR